MEVELLRQDAGAHQSSVDPPDRSFTMNIVDVCCTVEPGCTVFKGISKAAVLVNEQLEHLWGCVLQG